MEKELADIIGCIEKVRNLMEESIPAIRKEMYYILRRKERNAGRIECLLDILLDYASMGIGEAEFQKLNRYYASFNPRDAKFYSDFYRDITG